MDINQLLKFNIFVLETQEEQRHTHLAELLMEIWAPKKTNNSIITWTNWLTRVMDQAWSQILVMDQAWSQIALQVFHRFLGGNSKCYRN